MDIELIRFHTFYSATTNPPTNRDRSFQLKKDWNHQTFLEDERYENGQHFQQRFHVTHEQFGQIVSFFESLNIQKALFEKLNASSPPPMPPMVGGSSGSSFTVCANGVSVTANDFNCEGASQLRAAMESLKEKCGEPILDIRPPIIRSAAGFSIESAYPINMNPQAPQPSARSETTTDGWTCPNCGSSGNTYKFCAECGTPRSTE